MTLELSGPQTYLQLLVAREEREHVLVDLRQLKNTHAVLLYESGQIRHKVDKQATQYT